MRAMRLWESERTIDLLRVETSRAAHRCPDASTSERTIDLLRVETS